MPDETPEVITFVTYKDEEGRTVAVPLTDKGRDRLTNPKGIIFAEPFEERADCPVDPDVPREISTCAEVAIQAEELVGKRDPVNGVYIRTKMRQLRDRYRKEGMTDEMSSEIADVRSKLESSQKAGD